MTESFFTIQSQTSEQLFKEKNSKFFSVAFPISSADDVEVFIDELKSSHPNAGHFCYAYQLGHGENIYYRANDDGEPSNSAGMPIYGQILNRNLSNVCVVVVRYFGGVKLGVGGLIKAYRNSAKLALDEATVVEVAITEDFRITFDYETMSTVLRILKESRIEIQKQNLSMPCSIEISLTKSDVEKFANIFSAYQSIKFQKIENENSNFETF